MNQMFQEITNKPHQHFFNLILIKGSSHLIQANYKEKKPTKTVMLKQPVFSRSIK